jgi:hypothetical protein
LRKKSGKKRHSVCRFAAYIGGVLPPTRLLSGCSKKTLEKMTGFNQGFGLDYPLDPRPGAL